MSALVDPVDLAEAEAVDGEREVRWGSVIHDHAIRFLAQLAPEGVATFQTFDDGKQGRPLERVLHGTLVERWHELVRLNEAGAGVYVAVNRTDGRGRRNANIVAVRALFLDLDGAPIEPARAARPAPHLISETSPGRFHCLWIIKPCAPDKVRFAAIQKALARRFGGDPRDIDLARVCRVPGFWHKKGKEQLSRLLCEHRAAPYAVAAVVDGLELRAPRIEQPAASAAAQERQPTDLSVYGAAALDDAVRRIRAAPDGDQHRTLNMEGFTIGQLVAAGVLPEAALRDLLAAGRQMTSHDPGRPWIAAEVERQVKEAFAAGKLEPRGPRHG